MSSSRIEISGLRTSFTFHSRQLAATVKTIWFLCDPAVEIVGGDGQVLTLRNFKHPDGKRLASSTRTTIPPFLFDAEVQVVERYPG